MQIKTWLWLISIAIFSVFIPLSILHNLSGFIPELILFMALSTFYWWMWDTLKLNEPIYMLLVLGHALHSCGIFGWYGQSPLPIAWDHITHFFGLMPYGLLFFKWTEQWMTAKTISKTNLFILITIFLAASGVGAMVELGEFFGYLKFGFGEGAFAFGPGDGFENAIGTDTDNLINDLGGGWINTGWDLIYNTIGITFGILIMIILRLTKKKTAKAYYFEPIENFSKRI